MKQADAVMKRENGGSFKTKERYRTAMLDFTEQIAEKFRLKALKNVKLKHFEYYVESMKYRDFTANTIATNLSGLRWYFCRMKLKETMPPNEELMIPKREIGLYDRAWTEAEYIAGIDCATLAKRADVVGAMKLANYFGLRIEGTVTVTVQQISNALKYDELTVKEKGGLERTISVHTDEQREILTELLIYAKSNGKKSFDRLLPYSDKKGAVKQRKRAISDWIANNRHKFQSSDRVEINRQIKLADQAGIRLITESLSLHGLRYKFLQAEYAYFISQGIKKEEAMHRVSILAGHYRAEITKIYVGNV